MPWLGSPSPPPIPVLVSGFAHPQCPDAALGRPQLPGGLRVAGTARPGLHAPCFSHPGGPTYAVPQDASSQGKAPAPRATALAEGGCPHPQVLCLPPEDPRPPPALTPLRRTGRNHPVDAVATGLTEAYLLGCQGSGANSPGRSQWHIFISWHNVPRVSFMSLWETAPTLPGVCTSSAHSVPICSRGMGIPHLPWAGGWGQGGGTALGFQ